MKNNRIESVRSLDIRFRPSGKSVPIIGEIQSSLLQNSSKRTSKRASHSARPLSKHFPKQISSAKLSQMLKSKQSKHSLMKREDPNSFQMQNQRSLKSVKKSHFSMERALPKEKSLKRKLDKLMVIGAKKVKPKLKMAQSLENRERVFASFNDGFTSNKNQNQMLTPFVSSKNKEYILKSRQQIDPKLKERSRRSVPLHLISKLRLSSKLSEKYNSPDLDTLPEVKTHKISRDSSQKRRSVPIPGLGALQKSNMIRRSSTYQHGATPNHTHQPEHIRKMLTIPNQNQAPFGNFNSLQKNVYEDSYQTLYPPQPLNSQQQHLNMNQHKQSAPSRNIKAMRIGSLSKPDGRFKFEFSELAKSQAIRPLFSQRALPKGPKVDSNDLLWNPKLIPFCGSHCRQAKFICLQCPEAECLKCAMCPDDGHKNVVPIDWLSQKRSIFYRVVFKLYEDIIFYQNHNNFKIFIFKKWKFGIVLSDG